MMDLYKDMEPEIFAEDFSSDYTLASQILKKLRKGSLRDIFFASMLIKELESVPYKGEMEKTQVLKWDMIAHVSGITPFGMLSPEFTLQRKMGRNYLNNSSTSLDIAWEDGNYTLKGVYDRLERSIYMMNFPSLLNISKASVISIETSKGTYGWTVKEEKLPGDLLFAIAYAQKKGYGGIIKNNIFYPTPEAMFDEPTIIKNIQTPREDERYKIFLRAHEFYKLAGNFEGKVAEYKDKDDEYFAPENIRVFVPKGFLPNITIPTSMSLLSFVTLMLEYKPQGSFIIYPEKAYWMVRKSKYFQPGDRIITYAIIDDKRLKIDVNLGKYFYDYFLTKTYTYTIFKDAPGKYKMAR